MITQQPIRLLLCAPADTIEGGIVAVVQGLLEGFAQLSNVQVTRFVYAKFQRQSARIRRLLRELAQLPVFVRAVRRLQPDIVQFETSFDRKTLVRDSVFVWLAHRLGRPVVLHAHGSLLHHVPAWPRPWQVWAQRFLGGCDAIVVSSREELEALQRLLGPRPRLAMLPNPVALPESVIASSTSVHPMDREVRVVFAGRLIPAKGVLEAVEAMRHVKCPQAILYVFGTGVLEAALHRAVEAFGLENRVRLMGDVPLDDLLKFYCTADIFLFPSYHHEGFPMAFFFAAGCGMALVTTRVRPIPDYVTEPENCVWAEQKDPGSLATAIDRLASDQSLRREQGERNRALVAQFHPSRVANQLLTVYRGMLPTTGGT